MIGVVEIENQRGDEYERRIGCGYENDSDK